MPPVMFPVKKWNQDSIFIDKRDIFRHVDHKKISQKICRSMYSGSSFISMFLSPDSNYCAGGSLRGRGWKYGSGFVDGIFPVLSPIAQQILTFIEKEKYLERIWSSLDTLRPTNHTWDDLINVAVQLRINKQWNLIILMCEWILCRSSFLADMICYNLLIEAYGQSSLVKKAESTYLALLDARYVPTEDTSALLLKSYSKCGMLEKAETDFSVMRKNGLPPNDSSEDQELDINRIYFDVAVGAKKECVYGLDSQASTLYKDLTCNFPVVSEHVAEERIKILEKEVSFMRENQESSSRACRVGGATTSRAREARVPSVVQSQSSAVVVASIPPHRDFVDGVDNHSPQPVDPDNESVSHAEFGEVFQAPAQAVTNV
ncbi:Pentatricopeptide repeat-containing protein [Capsicum baccatum]|uniref:Pentatricopeptide repeat-containing protein n=1 Tax=Capsicum baccatum TaxID=33114 RepID=A0A2G2VM06_CAPBA|nr:Pentatricopeptide repeat-containing protein [Capsicum baccatum]